MDRYPDFSTLAAHEVSGRDYRIRIREMGAGISIVAPHGGRIEPGTSFAAEQIAGEQFNCYCFEGMKERNNRDLHISSHRFDEPKALELISSSDVVVTVHACKDPEEVLYIGGQFQTLGVAIRSGVESYGIAVAKHGKFPGIHPRNICNLGRLKKGVQLEISRGLRDDRDRLTLLSRVIRKILIAYDRQR